jgi:hypothetical protein
LALPLVVQSPLIFRLTVEFAPSFLLCPRVFLIPLALPLLTGLPLALLVRLQVALALLRSAAK